MATKIAKWANEELKNHIYRVVDEAVGTTRATLMSVGISESETNSICADMRLNLGTSLEKFRVEACWRNRPLPLTFSEIQLATHCAIIKTCTENGATEAVDLGYTSMARYDYFEMFASLDTRRWSQYMKDTVLGYMSKFVEETRVVLHHG